MLATARLLSPIAERAGALLLRGASDSGSKPPSASEAMGAVQGEAPRRRSHSLEIAVIETRPAFDALEADWNDLFERAGRDIHVFQTFNLAWHWCNHFLTPAAGLYIVTIRRAGRLALVWPLVRSRRAGIVRLAVLGEPISQYSDLLVEDADDKDALIEMAWQHLATQASADVIHLRRVRADANLTLVLAERGGAVIEQFEAPYLDLASAPDFATYEKRFTSKARKNRRRFLRRFEERAPTLLETYQSGTRARELAELAINLKRAWLKDRGLVSPALMDPRTRAFFGDVAEAAGRNAQCRVTSLDTRGEPAAIEIAFDCKGRRAVHLIVYALKYERMSAGQLLIERSLRNCFDTAISTYDLLTPADAYKLDWADGVDPVSDWAYAWTPLGRLYANGYLARLRPWLKSTVNAASARLKRWSRKRVSAPAAEVSAEQ